MRFSAIELLADPVSVIDQIVAMATDHSMASFAGKGHPQEVLAAVAEQNAEVAVESREAVRLLLIDVLRRHGAPVPDDFGVARADADPGARVLH